MAFTCPAKHHQQPQFLSIKCLKSQNPHSYLSIIVKCGRVLNSKYMANLAGMISAILDVEYRGKNFFCQNLFK